jgi:hypothetical protein
LGKSWALLLKLCVTQAWKKGLALSISAYILLAGITNVEDDIEMFMSSLFSIAGLCGPGLWPLVLVSLGAN